MAISPAVGVDSALRGEMEQVWLKELKAKRKKIKQQFHVLVVFLKQTVSFNPHLKKVPPYTQLKRLLCLEILILIAKHTSQEPKINTCTKKL